MNPASPATPFDPATLWLIAGWVLIALGTLVLLCALFKDRSRGRRRCPKCWYDMTGAPSLKCPECGRTARSERKLFKTRRRWRVVIAALLLLLLPGFVSLRVPRALEHGWLDAVPITLLRPALWWQRERAAELYARHDEFIFPFLWQPAGAATPTGLAMPTAWERLLLAAEIGRRMEQPPDLRWLNSRRSLPSSLIQMGRDARAAAPSIRRLNRGRDAAVIPVMQHLTCLGECDFTHDLLEAARDTELPERSAAAIAALIVVYMDTGRPSVAELVAFIDPDAPRVAQLLMDKCTTQATQQPTPRSIALIRAILRSPNHRIRQIALDRISNGTHATDGFEPELGRIWRADPEPFEMRRLLSTIRRFDTRSDAWGARIVRACEHSAEHVRNEAMQALFVWLNGVDKPNQKLAEWLRAIASESGADAPASPSRWVSARLTATPFLPAGCGIKLVHFGTSDDSFTGTAVDMLLEHHDHVYRRLAVNEIGSALGPERSAQLAAAILLREPDEFVRASVLDSIVKPFAAAPGMRSIILTALADPSDLVLFSACHATKRMDIADPEVVARLDELTRHETTSVAMAAVFALKELREVLPSRQWAGGAAERAPLP